MAQLGRLFAVFFQIGLLSIGGGYAVIPMIQEQVVIRWGWVPMQVFTDIITISQMTPGPLAVNASTFVGLRIAGPLGAVTATAGCVISGVCLSVGLYRFFLRRRQSRWALQALEGLKAVSVGLIASAALTLVLLCFTGASALPQARGVDAAAVVLFAASWAALRRFKVNPMLVMAAAGVLGGLLYG